MTFSRSAISSVVEQSRPARKAAPEPEEQEDTSADSAADESETADDSVSDSADADEK
jgi:hypothetical protein